MAGRPRKQRVIPPASEALAPLATGRPTHCTPTVTRLFADAYSRGVSVEDAAQVAGIKPAQAHEWMLRGERGEEPYRTFAEQSLRVKSSVIAAVAQKVLDAVDQDWRAGIAWLERVARKNFGKTVDVTTGGVGFIEAIRRAHANDDPDDEILLLPASTNGTNGTNGHGSGKT